jgi:hypothetical protein
LSGSLPKCADHTGPLNLFAAKGPLSQGDAVCAGLTWQPAQPALYKMPDQVDKTYVLYKRYAGPLCVDMRAITGPRSGIPPRGPAERAVPGRQMAMANIHKFPSYQSFNAQNSVKSGYPKLIQ